MGLWNFLAEKLHAIGIADALYHCNHKNTKLVYRVASNGVLQYTRQCQECYQDTTLFISHKKLSKAERASATLRDSKAAKNWTRSYYSERSKQQRESFWKLYTEYLDSPEWAAKRAQVLRRDKYTCQIRKRGCTHKAVQVHHLTYKNVGNEPLEDLASACVHCHDIVTSENRRYM